MKKVIFMGLALAAFAMTSCKKEFQCECTDGGQVYEKTGKGKDAADACQDAEQKVLGVPTETCVPA